MRSTYAVVDIFYTLQGEGRFSGSPAVFIRFQGCNIWTGREEDRSKGLGVCSKWCDTKFTSADATSNGGLLTAAQIVDRAVRVRQETTGLPTPARDPHLRNPRTASLCVLTGGEPSLQADKHLVRALQDAGFFVAMESNGSTKQLLDMRVDWLTISPKPPMPLVVSTADELKVVLAPGVDPHAYDYFSATFKWIQPLDPGSPSAWATEAERAVAFVKKFPHWRLSVQTHKILGVP